MELSVELELKIIKILINGRTGEVFDRKVEAQTL